MQFKYFSLKKLVRFSAICCLVFLLFFSNFMAVFIGRFGEIKEAQAAAPTFVAAGAVANSTAAITPALPAGIAANDILLLFLETSNQAISISNQNGGTWTEVLNSPQGTGAGATTASTRLAVFWSRYNGAQGAPTTIDSGDHQLGRIIAVRGVITSGNPWDVTAGGVDAVANTSVSVPGATTTVADAFVVLAVATALPSANGTANFSAQTNANLTSITERTDNTMNSGLGGGLNITTGVKSTAGNYGNTAVTLAVSSVKAMISIALKPPSVPHVTSFTNNTEGALLDGGRISQQITISGTNLAGGGTITSKDVCTTGAANGCVRVADYIIPAGNISSWTDTSIVLTLPGNISVFGGSGTTCGGTGAGLCVTQNGNNDPGGALTFYVYPDITSISPSGAGAGKEGDLVTISGNRFGASQGTGSVKFQACAGSDQTATTSVWGDTSISVTVPSGISDNADSCNVLVTRDFGTGSKTKVSNNFVVLPDITGMATCGADIIARDSACGSNAAQEYAAGDTYGLIQLNGNHFGSATGSISFTGSFGGLAGTVHGTAEGPCSAAGWSAAGTSVCLEVNPAIGNNIYNGTTTLSRNGDSKTDFIDLHILPRIISNVPSSAVVGDTISINGDHFCQTGACPVSPPTADYIVYFGSTQAVASDFTCWTDTQVCVKVPSGALTGTQKTKIQGKTAPLYESQRKDFTVLSTAPNAPANLEQKKSDGITVISVGGGATGTTVILKGDISAGASITMFLEVEVKPIATLFDGAVTASSTAWTGTSTNQQATVSGLSNGSEYHWRARTKNANTLETSNWVAFGNNPSGDGSGDGNPANRDFFVDTSAPAIAGVGTPPSCTSQSNITDIEATISWNALDAFNQASIANDVRYGTDPTLITGTTVSATNGTTPTKTLSGLSPSTSYYYWVRSTDSVGNPNQTPASSPFCSFTTLAAVTRIMKTTEYYIFQDATTNPNWHGAGAKNFDVYVAEHRPLESKPIVQKNAYIEIFGTTNATGNFAVIVSFNGSASTTYTVASPGGSSLPWFILHPVPSFNIDYPADTSASNTLDVDFSGTINSTSLLGAKAVLTFYYTP